MNYKIEFAVWRATEEMPKPDVKFVPMMERRRLTGVERAALSVAWQVKGEGEVPVVFASRWGEIGVTAKLMQQFHSDGEMSPAGFSASVHNATPGMFSLLTKNHAPYTAIAARERSIESGMLEAFAMSATMGCEVIFVYAEEATPDLYRGEFDDVHEGESVAMRIIPCEEGDFNIEYRHAELPFATFNQLTDFLDGRVATLETNDFVLTHLNQ